jgi:hypothetical protein
MLLCSVISSPLSAQVPNDVCTDAMLLNLSTPPACPQAQSVLDRFELNLSEATATVPFPALSGCDTENGLSDIWAVFTPTGNEIVLEINDLENGQFVLFAGIDCNNMYAVACGAGGNDLSAQIEVEPGLNYFLLMGGELSNDPSFELYIESRNDCTNCQTDKQGFFTASPAPVNGAYQGGEQVQMCFTVSRWNANFSGEFLHAVEVEFGSGWITNNLNLTPPNSCSLSGEWLWFDSWQSEATGETFGPGFAYDTYQSGSLDGNPGNNHGLDGDICSNIGYTTQPIQFCWTLEVPECAAGVSELNSGLDVQVRMLGDGLSGNNPNGNCATPPVYPFLATQDCFDPLAPVFEVQDASCPENCDGQIVMQGGGEGPWDYIVTNSSGVLVYISTGSQMEEAVTDLCPGDYTVVVVDGSSNTTTSTPITIGSTPVVTANATYNLPCFETEPIELFGEAVPDDPNATFAWTGPNGFTSEQQNPLVAETGNYTLVVSSNGCSSTPFELFVPELELPVVEIAEDTIVACPGDSLTITTTGSATSFGWLEFNSGVMYGSTSSITVMPENNALYLVNGTNPQGCTGVDQVVIQLTFEPELQSNINGPICAGDPVTLLASGGSSYLWSTGDTTATLVDFPTSSTSYQVTITDEGGCDAVFTENVSVATGSNLFVSPNTELCAGESTLLAANGAVSQQWSTGASTSVISVAPDTTTTYTVVQIDQFGCSYESSVTVFVNPDPQLSLMPADTSICLGESVTLVAMSADSVVYDTTVSPQQTSTYALPIDFGCITQPVFNVEVLPLPQVEIRQPTSLCGADSVLLIADGSPGTYLWSTGETSDSIYVTPMDSTVYSLTTTSLQGCSASDSILISPLAAPDAPVIDCSATFDQIVFSWPVDTSLTYSLIPISGPMGQPTANNEYIVSNLMPGDSVTIMLEVEDAQGCTNSTTATCYTQSCDALDLFLAVPDEVCNADGLLALIADVAGSNGQGEGNWSGPGVDAQAGTFDPTTTGPGTFELIYEYREEGCVLIDTATIVVDQAFTAAQVNCEATTSSVTFNWLPAIQDTAYTVEVLTGQSGTWVDEYTYTVDSLSVGDSVSIAITALGTGVCSPVTVEASCTAVEYQCPELLVSQDTFICEGESVILSVEENGWDEFSWSPAIEISCLDCPITTVDPISTTTYTVVATNDQGCVDTAQVTVYVEDFPSSYIPDTPIVFCPGEPFELCMPDGDFYYWLGPNGYLSTDQCMVLDNPTVQQAGRYYAIMRKGNCRFIKRFILEAAPPIVVDQITDFQTVCPTDTFLIGVSAQGAVNYSWSLPTYLDCPTCAETTGNVPQTATFTVTMEDIYGCTATANATVFVDDCFGDGGLQPGTALRASDVSIFPNPAADRVNVRTAIEGRKTVEIWNMAGQLVDRYQFEGYDLECTAYEWPAGAYVVRMISEEGVLSKRLQIQR